MEMDAYAVLVFVVGAAGALAVEHFVVPRLKGVVARIREGLRLD